MTRRACPHCTREAQRKHLTFHRPRVQISGFCHTPDWVHHCVHRVVGSLPVLLGRSNLPRVTACLEGETKMGRRGQSYGRLTALPRWFSLAC